MDLPLPVTRSVDTIDAPARQARLTVLGTGGTIAGSAPDRANGAVYRTSVLDIGTLLAAIPEIGAMAQLAYEQCDNIDSKNASPAFWLRLARRIETLCAETSCDGVVITHGTDTLEETAFFLDMVLTVTKPVVLTAAMRPANALSADGPLNLIDALTVAANPDAVGRGVLVVVGGQIHGARQIAKVHTNAISAFSSGEAGQLGSIQGGAAHFFAPPWRNAFQFTLPMTHGHTGGSAGVDQVFPSVEIVHCHAGVSRLFIDCAVRAGLQGIVLAAVGNGSLSDEIEAAAVEAARQGLAIVRSTRVAHGGVTHKDEAYDGAAGIVSACRLAPAKARILLMLALQTGVTSVAGLQEAFARA